ncbi:MAG TPA: outer membrane beta-barrel protein [Terriglobia bacterium]|nr:outer membrane beta-barrel protein [Terriglobia bacterium]
MRKTLLLLVTLLVAVPQLARAQRFEGIEVFGGYSYLQNNLRSTYSPFYFSPTPFGSNFALNGWQASITEKATPWLGLTQEFGGYYGTREIQGVDNHFNTFSILSGPRFYYPGLKGITPFAHALFGYDQTTVKVKGTDLKTTGSSYAMAFGGGVDVKVRRGLAIRLFQVDYYRPQLFGNSQNDLRFSAGIVFRFGGPRY